MNIHSNCPLCNSDSVKHFGRYYDKKGLVKCLKCGFVFAEKIPSEELLDQHYGKYSYARSATLPPTTRASYHKLLDELEPYRKKNTLLDIGCGRGWFLQEAQQRGWRVFGTEFSEEALRQCREAGIQMKPGATNLSMFDPEQFDVITSFEVIEHINTPQDELKCINAFLRKGGLFYCTTPNFNSFLRYIVREDYDVIEYPEHLSYYTKKTLKSVVEPNGFKTTKFLSTGISIDHLRSSLAFRKHSDPAISRVSGSDAAMRQSIQRNWYLNLIKKLVNQLLTITNSGMTLKGYFEKK